MRAKGIEVIVVDPAASEADLMLPDLGSVTMLGMSGRALLFLGMGVCLAGLGFGFAMYRYVLALPVHRSMREVAANTPGH